MEDEQQVSFSRLYEPQLTEPKLYVADISANESDGTHAEHHLRVQQIGNPSQKLDAASRWCGDTNLALAEEVRPERC